MIHNENKCNAHQLTFAGRELYNRHDKQKWVQKEKSVESLFYFKRERLTAA